VLELVSDFVSTRLATVLVAKLFDELMSCDDVSLNVFVELLLLALFDASAKFDDFAATFDNEFVEALDVPNVSEAFFVEEAVAVKPLLDVVFLLAFSVKAPANVFVLVPELLLVESPAVPPPLEYGLLRVEPMPPEVLPPLADWLLDAEFAGESEDVPVERDVAKALVALPVEVELLPVVRLPVAPSAAAPVLAEVAVRAAFFVDANVAVLFVAEFFDEAALNVSDALLLALAFCAEDFVSVLVFIVLNEFDLSLVYDLASVGEALSDVLRLEEKLLFLVTFEFEVTDN
jgi:hypothetical protein